ncbi:MAG: diguanylate cyclase [Anaerorhabdus sp.]|uniref:diguanylate cyclase n=1 Tax=Anaerorhabdus sp. TaxID=1872524 RepID=UPI003A8B8E25
MKYHDKAEYQNLILLLEDDRISAEEMKIALSKLEDLATRENDLVGLAAVNFYNVLKYSEIDVSKTIEFGEKTLSYAQAGNSQFFVMRAYNSLGIDYSEKADYLQSMNYYIKAYHIAIKNPEYNFEPTILNNIGNLFVWLKDYETAINFIESSFEQALKIRDKLSKSFLPQVALNIIELYSYIEEYSKVDYWKNANVDMDEERKEVVEIICRMNDIIQYQGDSQGLDEKISAYLDLVKRNDDFIYTFRSLLRVLEYSIDEGNQEICLKLIDEMKQRRANSSLAMHDLYFYECLYNYDIKYVHKGISPSNNFTKYYEISKRMNEILKTVCSKNLMMEIELDNAKSQKNDVLFERTILLQKVEKDSFTQLYNKVYMDAKINEDLKLNRIKSESKMSVLYFIDIDYFKRINDTLGHQKGDEILLAVTSKLLEFKNEGALIGRYGGDEFIIYMSGYLNYDYIDKKTQKLLDELRMIEIPIEDMRYLTCSIGVVLSKTIRDFKELCKKADLALYEVKEAGRNGYIIKEDV